MTRPTLLLNMLRSLLLLSLSSLTLPGQNANYRPGTTDPAGNPRNLTLFRDEQIYSVGLPSAAGNPWRSATLSFDGNVNPTSTVAPLPWSSDVPLGQINVQAAAGRILHPDRDDVFVVQRSAANQAILVGRFADGSGSANIASILDRVAGYTDFISVSTGDLDKLYDADGNYHDEVVVAWTEGEYGNVYAVPHVGVLNYNSKDPSNPTITQIRVDGPPESFFDGSDLRTADFYFDRLSQYGAVPANVPLPVDNIISTAVGDFDGDGANEIALAYMTFGGQLPKIKLIIYRYSNDGATASLTPVNSYDLSMPFPNGGMSGTVSLAAGNFDGSGSDQLLVSTVEWSGTFSNGQFLASGEFNNTPMAFLLTAGPAQGTITGAASSGENNSTTDFAVSLGSGVYVPKSVTIAGGSGLWTQINGTWAVTPTATGFTLDVDSSGFGPFAGQDKVTVTVAAPLKQADYIKLEPYPGTTTGQIEVKSDDRDGRIRVQAVPGLFHYDPNNGYDYRRREIALAWNARATPTKFPSLARDPDTHLALLQITPNDKIQLAYTGNNLIGNFQLFQNFSLAAGALRGDNATNDPTWSLYFTGVGIDFVGSNVARGMMAAVWKVSPVTGDSTKLNPEFVCSDKANTNETTPEFTGAPTPVCPIWVDSETAVQLGDVGPNGNLNYLRLPSIAADLHGNSLRLGAPLHMELTNPGKADFILEQPPQHAAWLDMGKGPSVVTINRYTSFNTSMVDSNKTDFASKVQDHTDWTAGVSEKLTAQASWSAGADAGPVAEASESNTAKLSARVSYDYDHVHDSYTSGYDSYTTGQAAATGEDDSLIVESQILDLWRYRIYGSGTATGDANNPNAFYDIVIPGPSLLSSPGGRDVDWYQPQHEVGNILSYPSRTEVCSPPDIGPITIRNLNISNKVMPLIGCQQEFYNGNSHSLSLQLDHQSGNGDSTDYTNKVSTGLDFKYSYRVDFEVFGNGGQFKATTDTDVHGGQDWGQLNTSDSTTTNATGITLNSPQGDSNHAYPYYPIFYNTEPGGLKVAYGVGDITASGAGGPFWTDNYAQLPDPALNLPNHFDATYGPGGNVNGWEPDNTIVRKRMKGFVIRRPEINSITGDYSLLGSNPQDGDKVLLEARVYNYSISTTPASFTVQFSVIPYDSTTDNEICANIPTTGKGGRVCPASVRTVIGTGTTQPAAGTSNVTLTGRGNTYSYLVWNTQGFGPSTAGANEYRVYVDLVSNTAELYPPEKPCTAVPCEDDFSNENNVDPGQNNEGWGLISVAKRVEGGPFGGSRAVNATHGSLDAGGPNGAAVQALGFAATAAGKRGGKKSKPQVAYLLQPMSLRLTAFSGAQSNLHGHVSVFDGKPGARNTKTIAIKTVHGVTPDGTSSWFTWTPKKKGPHYLYAVIQNTTGTTPLGDVVIHVRRAPGDLNGDGRVDRHDLNMLQRDVKKAVAESACSEECDLDGDGKITAKDLDLLSQACDSADCSFRFIEYVGGASPEEPDMREVRRTEQASLAAFRQSAAESGEVEFSEAQLFQTERRRKQSLRSIEYYYRGKPVRQGPFAQGRTVAKR
jgi:Dockerin type I domain